MQRRTTMSVLCHGRGCRDEQCSGPRHRRFFFATTAAADAATAAAASMQMRIQVLRVCDEAQVISVDIRGPGAELLGVATRTDLVVVGGELAGELRAEFAGRTQRAAAAARDVPLGLAAGAGGAVAGHARAQTCVDERAEPRAELRGDVTEHGAEVAGC